MAKLSREQREAIGSERLLRLLDRHAIASMRIIEQKISDAGPFNQRIDPHILTDVKKQLKEKALIAVERAKDGSKWFYLTEVDQERLSGRRELLFSIYARASDRHFTKRVGDALEISVFRALLASDAEFHGRFRDLDEHDDSTPYSKEEPPSHIGSRALDGDHKLDFLYRHPVDGWAAIECKNIREWIYPARDEVRALLTKTLQLGCVPVLIARRIHPSTFFVFGKCGLIIHQTYGQLVPSSDVELLADLKANDKMGFFDIKATNEPDQRMLKFIGQNLPAALAEARTRWNAHRDLLEPFCEGEMSYAEFAGRVGRRARGQNEDGFEPAGPETYYE